MTYFLPETGLDNWTMLKGIWWPHVWILALSMGASLIMTPVCRRIAMRWKVYDMPDDRVKVHTQPIPYLGGLAIFIGWLVPVAIIAITHTVNPQPFPEATAEVIRQTTSGTVPARPWIEQPSKLFWIMGAALLVMLLGLIDDLKGLSPRQKILGQIIAALLLVAGGMVFRAFPSMLKLGEETIFPPEALWVLALGVGFQIFLVVGACNATNLLDGLDGLCSGVSGLISVGFLLLATSLLAWDLYHQAIHYVNAEIIVVLSVALLGAVLGFLPYNFNPASIFMGDAGSMFLGFMAATFMILFAERPQAFKWFLGTMIIFGLPIFDTALTLVRRIVNRKPIFPADRSHFYDQLVDRGLSVRKSVLVSYVLSIAFGALGVGIVFMQTRYAVLVYLAVFAVVALAAVWGGMLRMTEAEKRKAKEAE